MKSERLRKIFHPFTNIPGVRKIFGPIFRALIYYPARRREIKCFQRNALHVLKEFDKICKENNINYCLFWGSLIGAVREHGFIKHDFDIDVAVWKDDYSDKFKDALLENGFSHKHRFLIDKGESAMEDTFEKDGVAIDIFYFFEDASKGAYCTSFDYMEDCITWEECFQRFGNVKIKRFFFDLPHKFDYVPFENIELPIPRNYDSILRSTYGDNYMTPDPEWRSDNYEEKKWVGKVVEFEKY